MAARSSLFRSLLRNQASRRAPSRKVQNTSEISLKEAQRPAARPKNNPADFGESKTPTKMDRFILVATRVYGKSSDIPNKVSYTKLGKARDLLRIRINIGWLFLGFIGEACAIMYGRRDARRGDSIFKEHTAHIKELREAGIREEQEKKLLAPSSS
eukprot:GHVO01037322.1.p1 GENE.GHVO01037322.1~~GHVO01037322.1.p1  ORF type:complete len:156 (+),score=10.42 GHVO01037322.1:181-648(+)